MKTVKKVAGIMAVLCLICALSACANKKEFENLRSFEFYFTPEEYAEEYRSIKKEVPLEKEGNYQIEMEIVCKSGSITVRAACGATEQEVVEITQPGKYMLPIPEGTADSVTFVITIDAETEGTVRGKVMCDNP